jgi:peptidoglycan/xylan/chitin deacetylase (PgdA/CDA1 family)
MSAVSAGLEARGRAHVSPGAIALTFDDGPDPIWTPRVLDELKREEATATFFVEAPRALASPGLIAAMTAAGHEVGLHCVHHVRHSEREEDEVRAEVEVGLAMLASLGVRPTAWRAPWGDVTELTRRLAGEHGLQLWGWSFDSHDWRGDGCGKMLGALRAAGGLEGGTVALMHDGLGPGARRRDCAETVGLTRELLGAARAAGLRPAPLSAQRAVSR